MGSTVVIVLSVILAVVLIGLFAHRWRVLAGRKREAENAEQMARRADATHEGARTRHEGGA